MRKFVCVGLSLLTAAAVFGGGGTARSADLDWRSDRSFKDDPIIVPHYRFSWTGFYVGGHVGYGWGDASSFDGGGTGFSTQPSGWMGGVQAGYNWQVAAFAFGIEADLGLLGASDEQSSATAFADAEYGGYATLTARLGFVEDRWLFYIKGGLALANIENRAGAIALGVVDPLALTELDETRAGWAIGAGVEYAFKPNWSMKIEYLYMDFGEDNSTNIDGDTFVHDNDLHTIKVGVNYRIQAVQEPLR